MKNWVRRLLLVQAAFFVCWAGYEEWKKAAAPVILLETAPVDPRDLLSGQFLMLSYNIGQVAHMPGFPETSPPRATPMGVLLAPGNPVTVGGRTYTLWKAVRCQFPPPADLKTQEGVWVVGTWLSRNNTAFGIERYYFNEKRRNELANVRSGHVYVEAKVGKGGHLVLKDLVY